MSLYFGTNSFFMAESIIAGKTYLFSLRILKIHLHLCEREKQLYSITKQLLRSGTSIGANVEEALGGHTERDFSAKMSIAYKEARETHYWLRLLFDSGIIERPIADSFLKDVEEIIKIIGSILKTVKQKTKDKNSRLQTPNSRLS
jgi:four helix bundle protein